MSQHFIRITVKLKAPLSMDQEGGRYKKSSRRTSFYREMKQSISRQIILVQIKISVMQQAAAKYPNVYICCMSVQIPSLLDSSGKVMLLCQSYFRKHLMLLVKSLMSEMVETHLYSGSRSRMMGNYL